MPKSGDNKEFRIRLDGGLTGILNEIQEYLDEVISIAKDGRERRVVLDEF